MFIGMPIAYAFVIFPLSVLPMSVLYGLSDFLFWFLYRVIGYRKAVVISNLQKSFPQKSAREIEQIAEPFYRHFCDLIVETIKSFTISQTEIQSRVRLKNPEVTDHFFSQGRSVILAGGHYGNWEWFAEAIALQIRHQPIGIYTPLSNAFMDRKMKASRTRFGLRMIPKKSVREVFAQTAATSRGPRPLLAATIFGLDQSPGDPLKAHWTTFLNQDTAVQFGAEKYAKQYDLPVVFCVIRKLARGRYEYEFKLITEYPSETAHGEITERVTQMLEAEIVRDPRFWLWTHRRWKHSRAPK